MTRQTGNWHASHERAILQKIQARRTPMNALRAWRAAVGRVQLGLGGRLDSGIVLEELLVQLDEALPLIRRLVFREDRLDRAHGLTRAAVDALVRMDVEHRLAFVDAIHRTDLDAGLVLHVDARFSDDVRHQLLPLSSAIRGASSPSEAIGLCTRIPAMCQAFRLVVAVLSPREVLLLGLEAGVEGVTQRV